MSVPICSAIEAAQLGVILRDIWILTFVGVLVATTDWWRILDRWRIHKRRRRIREIRWTREAKRNGVWP